MSELSRIADEARGKVRVESPRIAGKEIYGLETYIKHRPDGLLDVIVGQSGRFGFSGKEYLGIEVIMQEGTGRISSLYTRTYYEGKVTFPPEEGFPQDWHFLMGMEGQVRRDGNTLIIGDIER